MNAREAHAAATRDRASHADMVLDAACKDAVAAIRAGSPDHAHHQLATAGKRAQRVLGGTR